MNALKRIGIDTYMLLLLGMVALGLLLPARGDAAVVLRDVTWWAVVLLFFLYGAKLDSASVRAGLMNWRLQGLTLAATYVLFPLLGLGLAAVFGAVLGPKLTLGLLFLAVLPSTVQSSIAFTSIAHGNVPAAICAASLSNLIGVVLTPLLVAQVLHQDGGGVSLEAVERIALQILLPFVLGQVLRRWIGGFVQRHKLLTTIVDRGSILLIVYSAFGAGTVAGIWSAIPPSGLALCFLVVAALLALAMGIMAAAGRVFRLPPADQAVLFFCGSTKSLASGLPIASAIFPAASVGAIVLPVMIYHMTQLLVCSVVAQRLARRAGA
ncbi:MULTISPECIES: bile acid:sodium symporter family protein [unclassified Paracoccus (in: a-proteobacteria)]|uniref:bile acid:sodium symporter family protein n=1 Tax=unclassified Paracoccus (in: a-proteobacteria) TaxID=2688777 RepID=UPI0012B3DAC3|nr:MULTISPECIES: bile acid:sodium symporter family protein [unclassified Paracoccus (in: a-proteobacteria)]UXU76489.1 bile acid:sodium symporter [Paracoccus sp. SMMA_5]UXU82173.1 bile acid:sodium symporter [Paracoccus sp. SMMA_5_TC]